MAERKQVTILGSTGSIGVSTLDVIARHPDQYQVFALAAHQRVDEMFSQVQATCPRFDVMRDEASATLLDQRIRKAGLATEVLAGESGLVKIAEHPDTDYVMAAIVGAAGLLPTLAAVKAGKRILLANKEALVMGGALFMAAVKASGAVLLPIDSEHNAIFQCMPVDCSPGLAAAGISRILLTGSGGPFRNRPLHELQDVTPDQACAHPNWTMGRKISVDSATMMNKGLEFIEACWLFDAHPHQVEIVVHPQSVIHSMVEYVDGSVLAQLGNPDMRTPIAYGLAWPGRTSSGVPLLDLVKVGRLDFQSPDETRFPCLRLAREAMQAGRTASLVLNAANEVAVEAFLQGQIRFTAIAEVLERVMENASLVEPSDINTILRADAVAREITLKQLDNYRVR